MSSKIFCKSWGAEYIAADVVRFRLWATGQQKVMLRLAGKDQEMQASGDGWFTLDVSGVTPGTEYNFVLSDGMVVPDPASRAQKMTSTVRHMWLIQAATRGATPGGKVAVGSRPWCMRCIQARSLRKAPSAPQ